MTSSRLPVGASSPGSRSTPSERIADAGLALRRAIDRNVHASEALAAGAAGALRRVPRRRNVRPRRRGARPRPTPRSGCRRRSRPRLGRWLPAPSGCRGSSRRASSTSAPGPGATSWAATAVWPTIGPVVAVERERSAIELGRRLAEDRDWTWRLGDAAASRPDAADVVAAGYLLGELDPERAGAARRPGLGGDARASSSSSSRAVAPGSSGSSRPGTRLIAAGARIVAPCPGEADCPVAASRTTWCHFLARLDRSPLHRATKRAARSWEDEPFSYVVAARPSVVADPRPRVVLGRPRHRPGVVELRVCVDGRIETVVRSRRDGPAYRAARDLEWGDAVGPAVLEPG